MALDDRIALILTTEADEPTAATLASALVDRRVAACVITSPMKSVYRWEGETMEAAEVQLVVKTSSESVPAAVAAIEEFHSYDLPEIIVVEGAASRAYAAWVDDVTRR